MHATSPASIGSTVDGNLSRSSDLMFDKVFAADASVQLASDKLERHYSRSSNEVIEDIDLQGC
jgi:hypothetical protein